MKIAGWVFKQLAVALLLVLTSLSLAHADRHTTYYHVDAQGSVVAASNDAGTLLWRKEYAPFGVQLDSTAENEKLSYTGKEHDDATGLTYFGARYYDPYLGRFMSVDPAGINPNDPFTFNRYSYGNNNPYRFIDPNGRQSADTSCDEVCEEVERAQSRARGFKMVADGASDLSDFVDQEASSPWNWLPFGWFKKVSKGIPESANFAQKTFGKMFSKGGKFAGKSVEDVTAALRSGAMKAEDVPIDFIVRDGHTLILNTRSAQALTAAGIPRSQWHAVDRTGEEMYETMLSDQLRRNKLTNEGVATVRASGGS